MHACPSTHLHARLPAHCRPRACIHAHACACIDACTSMRARTHACLNMCVGAHTHMAADLFLCNAIQRQHVCTHVCTHVYARVYTHAAASMILRDMIRGKHMCKHMSKRMSIHMPLHTRVQACSCATRFGAGRCGMWGSSRTSSRCTRSLHGSSPLISLRCGPSPGQMWTERWFDTIYAGADLVSVGL